MGGANSLSKRVMADLGGNKTVACDFPYKFNLDVCRQLQRDVVFVLLILLYTNRGVGTPPHLPTILSYMAQTRYHKLNYAERRASSHVRHAMTRIVLVCSY